jgi:diguanylate cyclase (GGDEF)-like protein
MNFDGLLTTIVLLALVLIFGSILRRSANLRLHFWFIAWALMLIHCVVQWLGIPGAGPLTNEIIVADTLVCAGVAFLCSLCSSTQKHSLILIAAVFGLPICTFYALFISGVRSPWLLSSLVVVAGVGLITVDFMAGERGALLTAVIAANLVGGSVVIYSLFHSQPDWAYVTILAGIYLFNAILFYHRFQRVSTGVLTSIFGFITWGIVFPLVLWLGIHYPGFQPPSVLWNLPAFFVAVGMILTLMEEETKSAEWQATHDPLTGLPNRAMIDRWLSQATALPERRETLVALLSVDLDRFKFVNDNYGHRTGDEYLRQFANRLSTCIRKGHLFGRLGGDEFVVILESLRSEDDAIQTAMELIQSLNAPLQVWNQQFSASISIGIAVYPQDANTPANLHSNADRALYRAKEQGRNQCQCYSRCRSSIDNDTELESYLEYGLQENRFVLHYQPQVYADRASCGVEALLRFKHPTRGLLFPNDFLYIAEKNGLLHRVGEWVIQEACRQARIWRSQGLDITMSVNVSAVQFTSANFASAADRILQNEALPPHYLELELTESLLLSNLEESVCQMNRLKQLGVRIAIDDFGTGYSSLSYLHRLPIDVIKIDRSFIEKITDPLGTYPIVTAILSLAKALKVETVAEGIETEAQLALLTELGSQRFQGYLFSKPLPASDITRFLRKTQSPRPFITA